MWFSEKGKNRKKGKDTKNGRETQTYSISDRVCVIEMCPFLYIFFFIRPMFPNLLERVSNLRLCILCMFRKWKQIWGQSNDGPSKRWWKQNPPSDQERTERESERARERQTERAREKWHYVHVLFWLKTLIARCEPFWDCEVKSLINDDR